MLGAAETLLHAEYEKKMPFAAAPTPCDAEPMFSAAEAIICTAKPMHSAAKAMLCAAETRPLALESAVEKTIEKLFEKQSSVTLHAVTLCSAPLCSVHGYARVRTSIYIYIHTNTHCCCFFWTLPELTSVDLFRPLSLRQRSYLRE